MSPCPTFISTQIGMWSKARPRDIYLIFCVDSVRVRMNGPSPTCSFLKRLHEKIVTKTHPSSNKTMKTSTKMYFVHIRQLKLRYSPSPVLKSLLLTIARPSYELFHPFCEVLVLASYVVMIAHCIAAQMIQNWSWQLTMMVDPSTAEHIWALPVHPRVSD